MSDSFPQEVDGVEEGGGASESPQEQTPSRDGLPKGYVARYTLKVALCTTALIAAGLGILLSLVFLLDFRAVLNLASIQPLLEDVGEFVRNRLPPALASHEFFEDTGQGVLTFLAAIVNVAAFLVGVIVAVVVGIHVARKAARRGEYSRFGVACVLWTRNAVLAGVLEILAGIGLVAVSLLFLMNTLMFLLLIQLLPVVVGLGLLFAGLGLATLVSLPYLLDPAELFEEEEQPVRPPPPPAVLTGRKLLDELRKSPIYRRQVYCDFTLDGFPFNEEDRASDGCKDLGRRYPRIASLLEKTGIVRLTADQALTLREILKDEKRQIDNPGLGSSDNVFVGLPGSGRTTLANLLALSAVLHKEGAMYCVSPVSSLLSVDSVEGRERKVGTRHPSLQLRQWLEAAGMTDEVRVEEAYCGEPDFKSDIDFTREPDVVFSDVATLSSAILSRIDGDARDLVSRLRYVVIDHPNRLPREELIRLRLAIARLRMTAEMFGRSPTFILLLPPLGNYSEFAKFLLNNDNVPFRLFTGWPSDSLLVGWVPPLELLDLDEDENPLMVRAPFIDETIALLTEIGYQANRLGRQGTPEGETKRLRVAVIDHQSLLGPEAREHVRKRIVKHLGSEVGPEQTFWVRLDWDFFATADLAISESRKYDVVVCLGIGAHPNLLVASLRAALAPDGAMFLVANSSTADQQSLDTINAPGWNPTHAVTEIELPQYLLPEHSEAVIAFELASLFEDFGTRPLPVNRLQEVFPGEHARRLLVQWESEDLIEAVDVFEQGRAGDRPRVRPHLRRENPLFRGSQYEVKRGCSSRKVLHIYDVAAHNFAGERPNLSEFVDMDRLFIDLFPLRVVRNPPTSVMVKDWQVTSLAPEEREAAKRRAVVRGRLNVVTLDHEMGIKVDRRKPVFDIELLGERPVEASRAARPVRGHTVGPELEALAAALKIAMPPQDSPGGPADDLVKKAWRDIILGSVRLPSVSPGHRTPALRIQGGVWVCRMKEVLRDIAMTDTRLVEEPCLTKKERLKQSLRLEREFETVAVNLFCFPRDGVVPEGVPVTSRAAWNGFARTLERVLSGRYVNFDLEMRVAAIPNQSGDSGESAGLPAGCRIVAYGLRADEIGHRQTLEWLLDSQSLEPTLKEVHSRLESCDCQEGCSVCCGGLGTVPESLLPRDGFLPQDAVSRRGAYLLVCAVLGKAPDWDKFHAGARRRRAGGDDDGRPVPVNLKALLDEILGLPDPGSGMLRGGVWSQLFQDMMVLNQDFLASADWADTLQHGAAGLYNSGTNQVSIDRSLPEDNVREVIVHEFTHNWQFKEGSFDLDRHMRSAEAQQFFEGKLVIEGHATWSDNQWRFFRGLGAEYSPGDRNTWNEYKVGYFLLEGIEKAVGQRGLFEWIRGGNDPTIRSRMQALPWPFSLTQALKALDLESAARRGRYTDFDVDRDLSSDEQEGPESEDADDSESVQGAGPND